MSKNEPIYSLEFFIIAAVKIPLGSPDMTVTHQLLNGSEISSLIQESGGESMPQGMRMYSLFDQGLFLNLPDQTIHRFRS